MISFIIFFVRIPDVSQSCSIESNGIIDTATAMARRFHSSPRSGTGHEILIECWHGGQKLRCNVDVEIR